MSLCLSPLNMINVLILLADLAYLMCNVIRARNARAKDAAQADRAHAQKAG